MFDFFIQHAVSFATQVASALVSFGVALVVNYVTSQFS
jgi:hypothetical protein